MAAEWMRWFGYADATVTQASRDGGVDVLAEEAVAQVKKEAKTITATPIQALAGIASVMSR